MSPDHNDPPRPRDSLLLICFCVVVLYLFPRVFLEAVCLCVFVVALKRQMSDAQRRIQDKQRHKPTRRNRRDAHMYRKGKEIAGRHHECVFPSSVCTYMKCCCRHGGCSAVEPHWLCVCHQARVASSASCPVALTPDKWRVCATVHKFVVLYVMELLVIMMVYVWAKAPRARLSCCKWFQINH